MNTIVCRLKSYIQPFERRLALKELAAIAQSQPKPTNGRWDETLTFEVKSKVGPDVLADTLAYWECIDVDGCRLTKQVVREATANLARNGIAFDELERRLQKFPVDVPVPNRRCLRYGTHGIHEYRGKFFPQLVRSLINIGRVPRGGLVGDPMCGSGTTVVESVLGGFGGLGLDINPLSVFMTETKCDLMSVPPATLIRLYEDVRTTLVRTRPSNTSTLPYFSSLPENDQLYLTSWFSKQVLSDLDHVAVAIGNLPHGAPRELMRLSLSNILRGVSWQKDDDLRVRKDVRLNEEIDPIRDFLEELARSVKMVLAFNYQNRGTKLGRRIVAERDAREASKAWKRWKETVDAVITSPPYATALPYLDTDRLSLIYLQLLSRSKHRARDLDMIGNREIGEKGRSMYWDMFRCHKTLLSETIVSVIEKIERLNRNSGAGFRRQNLPALLSKYFFDMRSVLINIKEVLKPKAKAFIVVGNNHTIAGGKRVDIQTADLLFDLAADVGFQVEEQIPMEMLVSRDIFRKNAMASEYILTVRKRPQR